MSPFNRFPIHRAIATALTLVLLIAASQAPAQAAPKLQREECQAIVTHALDVLQDRCSELDRNKACYGNNQISTELNGDASFKFQDPGDQIPIKVIKTLVTHPIDVDAGTWGLSLLKLQANLPDTMPGQNITFLVYGDTSIDNASGDMQVFYFSSGLGQPTCTEIPVDGILVQSPNHTEVSFTVNGVNVAIASTIFMRATPGKSMDIQLIEGHAMVATSTGLAVLSPGETVSVPMGGPSGLDAVGAPGQPAVAPTDDSTAEVVAVAQKLNPPDGPPLLKNNNKGGNGKGNKGGNGKGNSGNGNGNGGSNGGKGK